MRAGDADAFGILVDRYGARITRLVRGFVRNEEDVRDIVQDAFVKAFSRLDRFDGRSRFARLGLLVHISAGFMQPGTFNNTVLEIFNMSPRPLRIFPGTPICQFIFQRTLGQARHTGRFSGQTIDVFRGKT